MIMADVLKIVFIILGIQLVFIGYWLAAVALFPRMVERSRGQYQLHFVKITLVGAIVMVPLVAIGLLTLNKAPNPIGKLLGAAAIAIPLLVALLGSAGLSQRIGEGLPSTLDEAQPWRRVLRGGVVLVMTFLLPFVGWFLVIPWTLISGLGALLFTIPRTANKPASKANLEETQRVS